MRTEILKSVLRLYVICILAVFVLSGAPTADAQTLPRQFTLALPLFALDSAWNQEATGAAVLSESDQQVLVLYRVLRGDGSTLSFPGEPWPLNPFVNFDEADIPIFRMGQTQHTVLLRDYEGNPGATNIEKIPFDPQTRITTVPAPVGSVQPGGPEGVNSDGWLVLYNPATFMTYDYWQATTALDTAGNSLGGGQIGDTILEAGAIDFFDVRGAGANSPTFFSARATGTPLLAGLILPEDIEGGSIEHALAFAIPGPRNTNTTDPEEPFSTDYFFPTSTTEAQEFNSNPLALASGQRLRLKQSIIDQQGNSIDEEQLAPITRMFLTALRTYGAYLVDNAGGFSFYAEGIHTGTLDVSDDELNNLIGEPAGEPLPQGKTKWQIAMEALNGELFEVPIAFGPWVDGQDPTTAQITTSNFEVIVPFQQAQQKLYLTHLGNGGGLQSDVVVFNPSSTDTATGEVNFFGDDGTPLDFGVFLPGGNSFTLSPLGSATLSTNGAGSLFTGSATVTSDTPISAVIRFDITGVGVAGVAASQVLTSAIAPVRRIGTLSSGVAVRNTGTSPIEITLELKDENGNVVEGGNPPATTLAGNEKIAKFLEDLFPDAQTTTFTGTICVTAQSGQIAVIALELDFFNNVFTTLPVAPLE